MPFGCEKSRIRKVELVLSLVMGIWNNGTTLVNAHALFQRGYPFFGGLMLFFLFLPGFITSIGFIILHWMDTERGRFGKIPPLSVFGYFILLFFFYPLVPLSMTAYSLFTGRHFFLASLAKLFEGFLDDGPQFVLKLIVVVLYGIGLSSDEADVIFTFSMVTSFLALIYFGLKFNERLTFLPCKIFLCFPMFCAFAAARAFTLAVFLKETLGNTKEIIGGVTVLVLFCFINMFIYRYCGQDNIRSAVFGFCSLLIPAGYGNDCIFYQRPYQAIVGEQDDDNKAEQYQVQVEENEDTRVRPDDSETRNSNENDDMAKMRSGLFLMLYTASNALLLSACAIYIATTRELDIESDNALILPLILAVVPGCFFALSRSILLPDLKPKKVPVKLWKFIKLFLCIILAVIAYLSLIPATFWTAVYKIVVHVESLEDVG